MSETKVIMPQLGESIFEGTITKWLKAKGETIQRDEPLFEISTDKIDSEIPSPASGTLKEILIAEGETVEINTVVALISTSGNGEAGPTEDKTETKRASDGKAEAELPASGKPSMKGQSPLSSPMVRRMAREHGVDLKELEGKGTGDDGRITKRDVLSFIEQREEKKKPDTEIEGERVAMTAMRKSIADHMTSSKRTSAHVATIFEVDCSAILKARADLKSEFQRAGVNLTITPFFVQAAARALRKFPIVNSSVDQDVIVYKKSINIGIAVAVEGGLIVPVIRNADAMNLLDLARTVGDLGERARTKKLLPDDVQAGTFTVTNPGNFGGLFGIPIINQPQVAILEVGTIERRPVVVDEAIAVRPRVYIVLSFDHRIIDGVVADEFMADVKHTLENWKPTKQ
jgi:pyruvate dehydrogenase E2 component (dihydrolipoamide acetyltransferase)